MAVGEFFFDFLSIWWRENNCIDFHRKDDLLVMGSEDDSIRLKDIANAKLLKMAYYKKHGAARVCFTHHQNSVICSSIHNIETTGESIRYLSMFDIRCLRYFKGHKLRVVYLCVPPINDSFMFGSLDHSRIWDLRVYACQGPLDTFLVGGDKAEVCDIEFSSDGRSMLLSTTNNHIYVLDGDKRCGFSLEPSATPMENSFTSDGRYIFSGSGDGTLHAWNINCGEEVASRSSYIGVASCLKWAPQKLMFVAASSVLTFWIPNYESADAAGLPPDNLNPV